MDFIITCSSIKNQSYISIEKHSFLELITQFDQVEIHIGSALPEQGNLTFKLESWPKEMGSGSRIC